MGQEKNRLIKSRDDYDKWFENKKSTNLNSESGENEKTTGKNERAKKEKALEQAIEIRKFEIELYWKRATYFWTIIAATFAGYFTMLSQYLRISQRQIGSNLSNSGFVQLIILNLIGIAVSFCWVLVNKGSKYWQNNWERHVEMLEDDFIGPLYKTVIAPERNKREMFRAFPYSVSKVNLALSHFVSIIWLIMLFGLLFYWFFNTVKDVVCVKIFVSFLATSLGILLFILILLVTGNFRFLHSNVIKECRRVNRHDIPKNGNSAVFIVRYDPSESKENDNR